MLLSTPRIQFRKFEDTVVDRQLVYQLNSDPQVMQFIGHPKTKQEAEQDLLRYLDYYEEHPGYGYVAAHLSVKQEFIGWFVVKKLPETGEPEIGYRLLPGYWGQGLATEGAQACLHYALHEMGFKRMVAVANPTNLGSRKVLEKVGMEYQHTGVYYGTECVYYQLQL